MRDQHRQHRLPSILRRLESSDWIDLPHSTCLDLHVSLLTPGGWVSHQPSPLCLPLCLASYLSDSPTLPAALPANPQPHSCAPSDLAAVCSLADAQEQPPRGILVPNARLS
jgi:hypothetical protein